MRQWALTVLRSNVRLGDCFAGDGDFLLGDLLSDCPNGVLVQEPHGDGSEPDGFDADLGDLAGLGDWLRGGVCVNFFGVPSSCCVCLAALFAV